MLIEASEVRQIPGEPRRRWFSDEYFDLIVWFAPEGSILGFQLCYDRDEQPRALTWLKGKGYKHDGIDEGDSPLHDSHKSAPVLVQDGVFDCSGIRSRFVQASLNLPLLIRMEVLKRIDEFRTP